MRSAEALGRFVIRMRWPLAGLYVLLVLALVAVVIWDGEWWGLVAIAIGLAAQALFCYARGDLRMLRPVRFHRSWVLAGIGGGLMAVLLWGMLLALAELAKFDGLNDAIATMCFLGSWVIWAVLFLLLIIGREELGVLRRMVLFLIGGSLLQLTATVTAHMIVLRRGGCLIGIWTGLGITCGASVLLWAFGPGVLLLFFYEARKRLRGRCPGCGYDIRGLPERRCPECGRPFTPHEVGISGDAAG